MNKEEPSQDPIPEKEASEEWHWKEIVGEGEQKEPSALEKAKLWWGSKSSPEKAAWISLVGVVITLVGTLTAPIISEWAKATFSEAETTSTPTLAAPQISNVRFCDRPCLEPGANSMSIYPEYTERIFVAWDYTGMQPGMSYSRVWSFEDAEWVRYQCIWEGPENGTFTRDIYESGNFRSGTWTVTTTIDGQVAMQAQVEVDGTEDHWDPSGELPCEDW